MAQRPFLSVIVPVYNAERYLSQTLNSILSQTFSDFEVICVDDCSSDRSFEILKEYGKKDGRIKFIKTETNVGAGKARDIAVDMAEGLYITFVDSDDTIEPELYEKAAEATGDGKADVVKWGASEEHFGENGKFLKSVPIIPNAAYCINEKDIIKESIILEEQTLFGYLWNSFYKTEIIKQNNLRIKDVLFYEDYFFNLDFIKYAKTMAVIDFCGYHYFKRRNESVTHSFTKDYFELSYERVRTFYELCEEKNMLDGKSSEVLGNKLIRYTLSAAARNNNPLSGLDKKGRKKWAERLYEKPLYALLLGKKFKTNIIFSLFKAFINKKMTFMILFSGKILYFLGK